ncbi:CAP-Gly domain-containing protein [Ephemerocybe angulata]|uniref:CAP-Gly domain-containing protein n=1 Tax=Ephemerocybe angulata TaxID=980116 RepID=A0A8H6IFM3_9AGAR|nr:CAP-Gly domain-containing protein [Tulosesus angulatus]
MATPGKPRQSGIPGPGRASSIPTPGRPRSASGVHPIAATSSQDSTHEMSRAFADAMKYNDPAQHRLNAASSMSLSSLSPKSASVVPPSGRRSVAGRPSSVASSSSALSASTRGGFKTPITSTRPSSRAASRQSESISTTKSRSFEVGDNVRIESLGFEGVLRYLGEIDGKPGQWAGVQLGGGFAGKGKNNGSVGGVQYFRCPDNCGVFVALSKLSAPTVGVGARPPSVASSSTRNGRATPAMTGRATPSMSTSRTPSASFSNGRITPAANGRATPAASTNGRLGYTTPSARQRPVPVPTVTKTPGLSNKITEGSRASKYMSMTAKDLSSRDLSKSTSARPLAQRIPSSPIVNSPRGARAVPQSPTRGPGSPFATPKPLTTSKLSNTPGFGKGRPSGTPRARLPSKVSMPPPASPFARSQSLQDEEMPDDYDQTSDEPIYTGKLSFSRPGSSASFRSVSTDDTSLVARLQSRLDALEYENERLRIAVATQPEPSTPAPVTAPAASPPTVPEDNEEFELLKAAHKETLTQIQQLQQELADSKTKFSKQEEQIGSLKVDLEGAVKEKEEQKERDEELLATVRKELGNLTSEMELLQDVFKKEKDALVKQTEEELAAKAEEMGKLKADLDAATFTLAEERKELGIQIDELRIAGQETIALYEERLSDVEAQRYDLQCRVDSFVEKASHSPVLSRSRDGTQSAAEIDNETLREQVQHLQKNISMLEEIIEDSRANEEKAKTNAQEHIKRSQDKVEAMKKEMSEGRKEVDRISRLEVSARNKIEEVEEALRESTFALESARAETETLRSELADLDNLVEGNGDSDISTRLLQDKENSSQGKEILALQTEVDRLKSLLEDMEEELRRTRADLEDKDRDLRDLKKRIRDVPVVNGALDTSKGLSPSSSKDGSKTELTGMKHIVVELQKENSSALHKMKLLESENELLKSEAEQLRQEVAILEENLDKSISQEENNFGGNPNMSDDVVSLQRKLRDQGVELDQLRKKLADMEMKHARTIHDLNKEISELEALVESKDELEQEIERLKEKTARYKKASKTPNETEKLRSSTASITSLSSISSSDLPKEGVCEICEKPGHDIFNCDLLKDDGPPARAPVPVSSSSSSEPYCEDCESYGHLPADCPHSQDVF